MANQDQSNPNQNIDPNRKGQSSKQEDAKAQREGNLGNERTRNADDDIGNRKDRGDRKP